MGFSICLLLNIVFMSFLSFNLFLAHSPYNIKRVLSVSVMNMFKSIDRLFSIFIFPFSISQLYSLRKHSVV